MSTPDFTLTLTTARSPQEVFDAVNNVRAWWSGYYSEEITGNTEKPDDEFSFTAAGGYHYSRQKLVEVVPGRKIAWLITESDFQYIEKRNEWTGTMVVFDISEKDGETRLTFTHKGLTPEIECYDSCAPAWTQYLENKLLPLINSGAE